MISAMDLLTEEVDQEIPDNPDTSEHHSNNENENNEKDENAESTKVKAKRVVRNPQPKLNAETLKGPKGLQALPSHFERVKFKGNGHEQEDLDVILKTYEYWCHRLFPKLPFDDCIEKIEKLGHKKEVKTLITKIRLDMLVNEQEIINENEDGDDYNNVEENAAEQLADDNTQVQEQHESTEITEEMRERIKQNRERAEKLRKERRLLQTQRLQEPRNENAEDLPLEED